MNFIGIMILILSGIYFSIKLKFKHLNIFKALKVITKKEENGISSFQALCISLASRIGVGSLSGVAISLYYGGIGSIFWMWLVTIICSSNTMIESMLSIKYRKKNNKYYEGGPFYYMNKGLNNKKIAIIYSIIFIISYLIGFIPIQSNTISKIVTEIVKINPLIIGIIIVLLTSLIIFNGIKEIATVVSKLIPFIAILYIITCLIIILKNINILSNIITLIIKDAFNIKSFLVGSIKSIFSTEVGLGTSAIASASSSNNNPKEEGLVQVFGVLFDTFVVSTLTAFILILSPYLKLNISNLNGIEITRYAFIYHLGKFGGLVLILSIILFAFSTIIGCYYYLEVAVKYITKNNNTFLLKIITMILILISTITSSKTIWNLIDISIVVLAIINTISLILLSKKPINDKL